MSDLKSLNDPSGFTEIILQKHRGRSWGNSQDLTAGFPIRNDSGLVPTGSNGYGEK